MSISIGKSERLERITEFLSRNASASLAQLSEMLNASYATIRRDIDHLSAEGTIIRLHGGASWPRGPKLEPPIPQPADIHCEEKKRIGRRAADQGIARLLGAPGSILLTGAGSSEFVGRSIKGARRKSLRREVCTIPTTHVVTHWDIMMLLPSFARLYKDPGSRESQ